MALSYCFKNILKTVHSQAYCYLANLDVGVTISLLLKRYTVKLVRKLGIYIMFFFLGGGGDGVGLR